MTEQTWVGRKIGGRYEIQSFLGNGGMAAVYRAVDPNLKRDVAVKLIHSHLSRNPDFVRRFEEEATAVARLRHGHIVQVHDFNQDNGTYFIVFEYVAGQALNDKLREVHKQNGRLPYATTIDIVADVADALDYAHDKGLVHRDIKPANIMIAPNGRPVLMDFGIAKLVDATQQTASGAILGTARYMAPEQVTGSKIDARTDIYALGVMLFEMISGQVPFSAESPVTLMMKHLNDPVPNLFQLEPNVPSPLVAIVNKALAKNPDDRFQTAAEMATALRQALTAEAVAAAPVFAPTNDKTFIVTEEFASQLTTVEPTGAANLSAATGGTTAPAQPAIWQNPMVLGAAGLLVVVLLGLFVVLPRLGNDETPEEPEPIAVVAESSEVETAVPTPVPTEAQTETANASTETTQAEPLVVEATSVPPADPLADYAPLFLTSYSYEGLIVAVDFPTIDVDHILFSLDDPTPTINNGRTTAGTTTIANNSMGPIPLDRGNHTLYVQYVLMDGTTSEVYPFEYEIDDIVINFAQQPYNLQTDGIPAIFTMAIVESDPDGLYTYNYSVDTKALDQSVQGVGQAGVIQLENIEVGDHMLYVRATGIDGEETAVVAFPFKIE
ncbi:MAG: protein kinase [Chloroflexota bacterium]